MPKPIRPRAGRPVVLALMSLAVPALPCRAGPPPRATTPAIPATSAGRGDGQTDAAARESAARALAARQSAALDSPAGWLRRAAAECRTPPGAAADPDQAEMLSEGLSLAAAGQLRAGDAEGLSRTLDALDRHAQAEPSPASRALAFVAVADLHFQRGDRKAYWAALDSAKAAARECEDEASRGAADLRLACLCYRAGEANEADDIVRATQDAGRKASLYCALAVEAAGRRDRPAYAKFLQQATAAAAGQDEAAAGHILLRVGQAYALGGDFDAARLTAEAMGECPVERVELYQALARRQAKAGDVRGSRDSLAKAAALVKGLEPARRLRRAVLLAYEQSDLGDREGARQSIALAESAADALDPAAASRDGTERHAEPRAGVGATANANGGPGGEDAGRARPFVAALYDLAEARARLGDAEGCLAALRKADGIWADSPRARRGEADARRGRHEDVVAALARSGQLAAALRVADGLRPAPPPAGLTGGAAASDAADGPADETSAAMAWLALCEAQARAGRPADARATAARIVPLAPRAQAYRRLAAAWAATPPRPGVPGDLAALDQWAGGLPSAAERAYARIGAAEGLLGRPVLALTAVELFELGIE